MGDQDDSRLRFTESSRRVLSRAKDSVKASAVGVAKKSPKAALGFLKLLHIPYLPPVMQHGKTGWLVKYVLGPFDTVT